jgi:dihydrodipicolinate synthase/N-acetylneuraminate lyase
MTIKDPGGIICPIASPLTDDENIDVIGLRRLIERSLPFLDGLFVLGSSGEFAMLSDYAADSAVVSTLEIVDGRLPVYVGCSDAGTKRAISKLKRAEQEGIKYVVATSSYYYMVQNQEAMYNHFLHIANESPLPVVIYNIPQNTGINLTSNTIGRLSEHANIIGLKDSTGDMFQFQEFLALKNDNFIVMQGREQLAAASLWLGADGIVSALPNIAPHFFRSLVEAVAAGDHEKSLSIQKSMTDIAQIFDQGYWVSGLKAALYELGIGNGSPAMPIPRCRPDQFQKIRSLLTSHNLLPTKERIDG